MVHETGNGAAAVAPIDDADPHARRRLLSGGATGSGSSRWPIPGGTGGPSLLERLDRYAGNTKIVVSLLVSIVAFSYLSQEYAALSAFPTKSYESETTLRPASSSSWAKMFVASLRDAGSSLLGGGASSSKPSTPTLAADYGCRSYFAVCDANYRGKESEPDDFLGNRPSICTQADEQPAPAPDQHVFNVSICKSPARLHLSVDHLVGFVDNAANRQWEFGPDFIEAEIVGPELRLETFRNTNGSLYEADIGAAIPGGYTFDITVAYTPFKEEETEGKEEKDWPFVFIRNLVLAGNETWTPSEVALPELEKDKASTRALADGRWVRTGTDDYPHARSEMYTPEARKGTPYLGYRCSNVGDYVWTPQVQQESSSWERFKTKEQIHECLRKAKPAGSKNNFTRVVMYGDSHSRTTLNGFLNLLFPEDEGMRAQKSFKSTTESQCFGGEAFGFEVCFQWNAWVCDRPNIEPLLETFDYMTVNIGHWMMVCPGCGFEHWQHTVEGNIRSFAEVHHNLTSRGEGHRLRWLQTSLVPGMNREDQIKEGDRRQIPKLLHINNYTDHLLEELQVPQLRVKGILLPFHDCSEDKAHFHFGLPETVAKEKILPWICPADGSE